MPPSHEIRLDQVFQALADPTRRAVVARLSKGPVSTSALAGPFAMALPSFTQHLGVLESCGLVRSRKNGRVRTYELTAKPLKAAEAWISMQRGTWEKRLDHLDAYLMTMKEKKS